MNYRTGERALGTEWDREMRAGNGTGRGIEECYESTGQKYERDRRFREERSG